MLPNTYMPTLGGVGRVGGCCRVSDCPLPHLYTEAKIGEDIDKRDYIVSNAKIEGRGWFPSHTLEDGIDELAKFYGTLRATQYGNA